MELIKMNKTLAILSTAILLATATVTEAKQTNVTSATHTAAASKVSNVPYEMVKYGDVSIQAYVQGKGPTIVIMSSLGRSVRDYDVVAQDLVKQGFRVIRPEVRGIGLSRGPMEKLHIQDYGNDVAAVIEHFKAGPAIVVGHAWGNFPTRMVATQRPDLVKGVVLAGASAGKVPEGYKGKPIGPEIREAIDNAGNEELPEAKRIEYLKRAFFAPMNDPRVWLTGWHHEAHDAQGYARNNTPVDDYFAAGKAPILDIQPEYDTVAPKPLRGVLKGALGDRVTIVEIKNAGHALVPEQPKALADAIGKFAKQQFAKKS